VLSFHFSVVVLERKRNVLFGCDILLCCFLVLIFDFLFFSPLVSQIVSFFDCCCSVNFLLFVFDFDVVHQFT